MTFWREHKMKYNFDEIRDRSATEKWKETAGKGALAMGIADMDFAIAPEISDAIRDCADAGEFGYSIMSEADYTAITDWLRYRSGIEVPAEHILATPGVLYAARTSLYALTNPGDKVIVNTPLHTPSIATASMLEREALINRLVYRDGKYYIDFEHLEKCFKDGAKAMMLCAPNNPTGRVWTLDELRNIAFLVNKYNAYLITDEIHRDIVWEGYKHISPTELPEIKDRSVAVFSTSKTFNMGGFHIGSAIIPNQEIKERVRRRFYNYGHVCGRPSTLCIAAQTAAYTRARPWFEAMMKYVGENIDLALSGLEGLPIRAIRPEGTFLLWIDVSDLKMRTMDLYEVMEKEWLAVCDRGIMYDTPDFVGKNPIEHHLRMNLATPRANVEAAIERIRAYFKK